MGADTKYTPFPFVYSSRGLAARWELDRVPEGYFIQNLNILEREENSVSSRYGYQIVNRDPNGTPSGQNYLFPSPIVSIAKLFYQSIPLRFVGLANGQLWYNNTNSQGEFAELTLPKTVQGTQLALSGEPFGSLVSACYETSLPFLFIYDSNCSVKVSPDTLTGLANPLELTGIDPSPYTLNVNPYAPLLIMIEPFPQSGSNYDVSDVSGWGWGNVETLNAESGQLITDFSQFYGIGPSGGGTTTYPVGGTSTAMAMQTNAGQNTAYGGVLTGFPAVVPTAGETVSLTVTLSGYGNIGSYGNAEALAQYSPDGGTTWIVITGNAIQATGTIPGITITVSISITNLALLQVRAEAFAVVATQFGLTTTDAYVTNVYAAISNPAAFGPVVNGMLSVLNSNQQAVVPISSVTSTDEVDGIYQQLSVVTQRNHGLSASDTMAIYASSNDLVDGFYQLDQVTASNSFLIPFLSATAIGAQGGYVTYAETSASNYSANPPYCVLSNQYSSPYPTQMSAWGFYEWVPPTTSVFPIEAWSGTVAQSSTGSVTKNIQLDLNQNNQVTDADLIVLTLLTDPPENIAQITLTFFVGQGGNNCYQAFISPAYFQGAVAGTTLAYQATQNQILADALNLITGQTPGTTSAQLQPTNISSGSNSWQACLIPRGNFLPVGQAGQAGLDWANVTGWEISVTTNSNGSASFSVNGLYLQWGYGPSSFAGVGYDWRFTYYNANTGTESSPNPSQAFNADYGYLASTSAPIYLRQAAQCVGYYSSDPQVTHVRLYRRGGILASNWVQVLQAPNVTGAGQFTLKDVIADSYVLQAPTLVLDNDPPVTSSLVRPLQFVLASATNPPGGSIYSTFQPQLVFIVPPPLVLIPFYFNMIVEVGNADNLELVSVIQGGYNSFTAIFRLQHNQGEPVNVYATPRQPCDLCCIANLPGGAIQVLLAGDKNNPARVYYSKPNQPENFGPEDYLDSPTPNDAVMALINWRGTALVATQATWYIFVGGSQPYLQPTGAAHGIVASQGWCLVEGEIFYLAADGWRAFSGADGKYMTLPVEWLFRTNPECLPPQVNANDASQTVFAYYNNQIFGSYISLNDGVRYRLIYDTNYQRFRQDDIGATAMLWERDTNLLLCGVPIYSASDTLQGYALVADQQYNQDYDDGGWSVSSTLIQTPIDLTIQLPFKDLGKPHFPKQFNALETDANTQNQPLQTTLYFNTEPQTSIVLPAVNSGSVRQKIQQQISDGTQQGDGYQAYAMSILHTMSVTVAPTLFQENIYAAILADYRSSFDSYWQKASMNELKLWKECYLDYTATESVEFSIYANGNLNFPYFNFTLPVQAERSVVRVLFPAYKCRLWRMIGVSTGNFQLWAPVQVDNKPLLEGSAYTRTEYGVYE